ncbi:MAG: hypothetical protein V1734_01800 [Nanoarchaeota archaeon]
MKQPELDTILMAAYSLPSRAPKKKKLSKKELLKRRYDFANKKNLEDIAKFALQEKREIKHILTGVYNNAPYTNMGEAIEEVAYESADIARMAKNVMPHQKARTQKDMEEILEDMKPYFYELSGIEQIKDPELRIMPASKIRLACELFSPAVSGIAVLSALFSGFSYMVSKDIALSASLGAVFASVLTVPSLAFAYFKCRNTIALALPPDFRDRIYVPKAEKYQSFSLIAHEFVHNACFKSKLDVADSFIAEGFATAMSDRILVVMGKKYPYLEIYARKGRMDYALMSFGTIFSLACNKTPDYFALPPFNMDLSLSPKQRIESNIFSYVGGATMFNLAEYRYGSGIYKEVFNKDYSHILS